MVVAGEGRALGEAVALVHARSEPLGPAPRDLLGHRRRRGKVVVDRGEIVFREIHVQDPDVDRGDGEELGDPFAADRLKHDFRHEAAEQRERRAGLEPAVHDVVLAEHVEQRQEERQTVALLVAGAACRRAHVRRDVVVRQGHALRDAGGAGGVEQYRGIVRLHGRGAQRRVAAGEPVLERDLVRLPALADDGVLDRRAFGSRHVREQLRGREQDLRSGVVDDVAHFLPLEDRVDRDHDRADLQPRQVREREGRNVRQIERDAVAAAHPVLAQRVGERRGAVVQGRVGDALAFEQDGGVVFQARRGALDVLSDVHLCARRWLRS